MPLGDVFRRFARLSAGGKLAAVKLALNNPRLLLEEVWPSANNLPLTSNPDAIAAPRPAPFVLLAANHGTFIVNRNDFCGSGPFSFGVGHQLLNTSEFNPEEIRLARLVLAERKKRYGRGVVAVDCGANLGVHTIEWARQMADWGSVIAIEAQERMFYSLCGNININNCLNARAIWAAVGAKSGKISIPVLDYNRPASYGSLEIRKRDRTERIGQKINYDEDACVSVDLITIDDLDLQRLDLIKIDVEGMEIDVFLGARKTIQAHKPVIIVEVIKSDQEKLKCLLSELGYSAFRFAENVIALHDSDRSLRETSSDATSLDLQPV